MAGELSGDLYGAGVIDAIRKRTPEAEIVGIGGPQMKMSGAELYFDISRLAVVGIWEVLTHGRAIWQALRYITHQLDVSPPDLVILIDYPGFNLKVAKAAHRHGIKVLYYVSPQIWAWHKGRIKQIAEYVDMMAVILPFEEKLYQEAGIPVEFVGHPLTEQVTTCLSTHEALTRFGLEPNRPVIGLLPGSRRAEIKYHLDLLLEAARMMWVARPELQFILPVAPSVDRRSLEAGISKSEVPVKLVFEQRYDLMRLASVVICASGTVTLEAALLGTPMVVIYRFNWFTYLMGRLLVDVQYISLVNILAEKQVVTELIQKQAHPSRIASEALSLLEDNQRRKVIEADFISIRKKLGPSGASTRVAELALALCRQNQAASPPAIIAS